MDLESPGSLSLLTNPVGGVASTASLGVSGPTTLHVQKGFPANCANTDDAIINIKLCDWQQL